MNIDKMARRIVEAVSKSDMDMVIRMTLLEGVAGVKPGTFTSMGGMVLATRNFPEADSEWFDRGVSFVTEIEKYLRNKDVSNDLTQEVINEIFLNRRSSSESILYQLVKTQKLDRSMPSLRGARALVAEAANNKAIDLLRKRNVRKDVNNSLPMNEEGGVLEFKGENVPLNLFNMLSESDDGPLFYQVFREYLEGAPVNPLALENVMAVFDLQVANPYDSDLELARKLKKDAKVIQRAKKTLLSVYPSVLEKAMRDPRIRKIVKSIEVQKEVQEEFNHAGKGIYYGGLRPRAARRFSPLARNLITILRTAGVI